mmetsp:Transcript_12762/g.22739  ORF Transcript_12762/g.22739 Transcript_12762/m.22739 type:complete len:84 (+) Transcript_12762:1190-1441(+)
MKSGNPFSGTGSQSLSFSWKIILFTTLRKSNIFFNRLEFGAFEITFSSYPLAKELVSNNSAQEVLRSALADTDINPFNLLLSW